MMNNIQIIIDIYQKTNKQELFNEIDKLAKVKQIVNQDDDLVKALNKREKLGSTLIDEEVAMPHVESSIIKETSIIIINAKNGIIDWEDGIKNVQLVVFLLIKENEEFKKLKEVQNIVRYFADSEIVQEIKKCNYPSKIKELLKI